MTALTINTLVDAGTKPVFQNSSASDTVTYDTGHNTFLVYKNTGGSPCSVVIVVPGNNAYGQPNPDPSITVPATTGEVWIPIRNSEDDGNGTSTVTLTVASGSGATLQVAAVRVNF